MIIVVVKSEHLSTNTNLDKYLNLIKVSKNIFYSLLLCNVDTYCNWGTNDLKCEAWKYLGNYLILGKMWGGKTPSPSHYVALIDFSIIRSLPIFPHKVVRGEDMVQRKEENHILF